ncbi:hypothetical protein GGS20DRAFT_43259 [Poronia punctata]|nr:hypothetical protein GGS20DRAFT_43259 [Poronia punctata]
METESSASVRGGDSDAPRPNPNPNPKLRSCAVCRTRKVRCDKQSPCSNCRRANIPCVFPSVGDRPPRWARRMAAAVATEEKEGSGPGPGPGSKEVMERLRSLEDLVKSLSGQLEQAQSQARNSDSPGSDVAAVEGGGGGGGGGGGNGNGNGIQSQFGRLVLKDANANANRSRYVSTGFWSRVNDEVTLLTF